MQGTKRKLNDLLSLTEETGHDHLEKVRTDQTQVLVEVKSNDQKNKDQAFNQNGQYQKKQKTKNLQKKRNLNKKKQLSGQSKDGNSKSGRNPGKNKSSRKRKPEITWKPAAREAMLNQEIETRLPLLFSDLQSVISYCLLGMDSPLLPYRFCSITDRGMIKNMVCIIVDGVDVKQFEQVKEQSDWIQKNLQVMEVINPATYGSSVMNELVFFPVSNRVLSELMKTYGNWDKIAKQTDLRTFIRPIVSLPDNQMSVEGVKKAEDQSESSLKLRLLLSASQMAEENYPLKTDDEVGKTKGFVYTKDKYLEVHDGSPLLAIDCEFCCTTAGTELSYVCVVNEKMEVVYKSYVKPDNKVIDYQTEYSGVQYKDLVNITTRLPDVQEALREILPGDCILVGHALNSDLRALNMVHPYVIDTSVIFNLKGKRFKSKLRDLSSIFLNKAIQENNTELGHCPEEDAIAAMELTLLKLNQDYHFGDVRLAPLTFDHLPQTEGGPKILDVNSGKVLVKDTPCSLVTSVVKRRKSIAVVASESLHPVYKSLDNFDSEATLFQTGKSTKALLSKGMKNCQRHDLTLVHCDMTSSRSADKLITEIDSMCKQMYSNLSKNGLFMLVMSGATDNNSAIAVKLVQ